MLLCALSGMSSVHHAARLNTHSQDVLGGWSDLVYSLVAFHVLVVVVWIGLWVRQAVRGGAVSKPDGKHD